MPRKRQESIEDANYLLNFSCGIPSDLPSTSHTPQARKTHKKNYKKLEAERKERSLRDKLSSSFFLQASASHAFIISRDQKEKQNLPKKDGNKTDRAVKWDIVRAVKCLVPATGSGKDLDSSLTTCSICLDNFVASRIAPCGHLFCYPCILRHLDSSSGNDSTKALIAKCPCCYHLMSQKELRPVEFVTYQSPSKSSSMEFRKLYRCKTASAPFIPSATKPRDTHSPKETIIVQKRVSSGDFPFSTDKDASFSRFNYLDTVSYQEHFANDIVSLQRELENISVMYSGISGSNALSCENDKFYVSLAIQAVQAEQSVAEATVEEEKKRKMAITTSQSKDRIEVLPFEKTMALAHQDDGEHENKYKEDSDTESNSPQKKSVQKKKSRGFAPGTMYMSDEMVQYYQAVDGQLCFLSGFNLNCLSNEFDSKDPVFASFSDYDDRDASTGADHKIDQKPPFPDVVKGQVIDVEQVHLTPDILKRMPCFSHLPLYTDITMVEIDINGSLSSDTRERFKKDVRRRREKRQAKKDAEKKAEREARQKEEERIEELKRGIQRIDPNDPFFRAPIAEYDASPPNVFDAGDFNHSLHAEGNASSTIDRQAQTQSSRIEGRPMSFSSACTASEAFPSLDASNTSSFPSLAASTSTPRNTASGFGSAWGSNTGTQTSAPRGKKNKGKKVVLFSTGGRRK